MGGVASLGLNAHQQAGPCLSSPSLSLTSTLDLACLVRLGAVEMAS